MELVEVLFIFGDIAITDILVELVNGMFHPRQSIIVAHQCVLSMGVYIYL